MSCCTKSYIVYYKYPSFEPLTPVRVSFENQPAVDTGSMTRQIFTDVLHKLATGALQLFIGSPNQLRQAYSPQVLPLVKILGTLIAHSLVHKGPGFPYISPFVYWYIATGCEEQALSYVSIPDDLSQSCMQTVKEVCFVALECAIMVYCSPVNVPNNSSVHVSVALTLGI